MPTGRLAAVELIVDDPRARFLDAWARFLKSHTPWPPGLGEYLAAGNELSPESLDKIYSQFDESITAEWRDEHGILTLQAHCWLLEMWEQEREDELDLLGERSTVVIPHKRPKTQTRFIGGIDV